MLKLACGSNGLARCGCGLLQGRRALHVGPAHVYAGHAPVRLHVPVMSVVLTCVGASSAKQAERKQSWRLLDRAARGDDMHTPCAAARLRCTHAARTRHIVAHNQHHKPQVNAALAVTKNGGAEYCICSLRLASSGSLYSIAPESLGRRVVGLQLPGRS